MERFYSTLWETDFPILCNLLFQASFKQCFRTPEHWQNNGTLAIQSEYRKIVENEKSNGTTDQQKNTRKY